MALLGTLVLTCSGGLQGAIAFALQVQVQHGQLLHAQRPLCIRRIAAQGSSRLIDVRMGRGGAARGGGRGTGARDNRGKGKRPVQTDLGSSDERSGGHSAGRGKKALNQMLRREASPLQPAGAAVGSKMQDFNPKQMERGTVRFLGSFDADPPQLGLPEVAFVGRSNVGKSSLLNCLTNSKIAVTSKTPGRTQRVNIFAWKEAKKTGRVIGLVDLPGFGFAQVARGLKERISDQLGQYIAGRKALKLVVVLVDLRIDPQKPDLDAMELLYSLVRFIAARLPRPHLALISTHSLLFPCCCYPKAGGTERRGGAIDAA